MRLPPLRGQTRKVLVLVPGAMILLKSIQRCKGAVSTECIRVNAILLLHLSYCQQSVRNCQNTQLYTVYSADSVIYYNRFHLLLTQRSTCIRCRQMSAIKST